ncbi:MAG: Rid family hydrolase [Anaerolineae bacterium]
MNEKEKKKLIIPDGRRSSYDNWHFAPAVESVGESLTEAGLTFADVVEMTTYHVGLQAHLKEFIEVKDRFVPAPYPAWTAIGVVELAVLGAVIEVQVTAKF